MSISDGSHNFHVVDIFNVTSGTWSTAAQSLSVARYYLAATSLPNLGVAIFAGGYSTFFMLVFVALREGCFLRDELNCLSGVVCMVHVHLRWKSQLSCCGHLQRDVWNLVHCSSQRSSRISWSHVAAESWSRALRWRPLYVYVDFLCVECDCEGCFLKRILEWGCVHGSCPFQMARMISPMLWTSLT
jgi:hypothetical protein